MLARAALPMPRTQAIRCISREAGPTMTNMSDLRIVKTLDAIHAAFDELACEKGPDALAAALATRGLTGVMGK